MKLFFYYEVSEILFWWLVWDVSREFFCCFYFVILCFLILVRFLRIWVCFYGGCFGIAVCILWRNGRGVIGRGEWKGGRYGYVGERGRCWNVFLVRVVWFTSWYYVKVIIWVCNGIWFVFFYWFWYFVCVNFFWISIRKIINFLFKKGVYVFESIWFFREVF